MDTPVVILIGLGVAGLVTLLTVLIVVAIRRERERQRRIREWAAWRGWTVTPRPSVEWIRRLPGGVRAGVSLLVSGTVHGWPVGVAEYAYVTESRDSNGSTSTTQHNLLVTVVRLARSYPPVAVSSRGALSRFGRAVFGDNAAATGVAEFDRRFRVATKDPAAARGLIGPALIAEHLAGRVPAWSLAGPDLLTWTPGIIKDPAQIEPLAATLVRVAYLLGR